MSETSDVFMSDASTPAGSPLARLQRGRDRDAQFSGGDSSMPSQHRRQNGTTPDGMQAWSVTSGASLAASVISFESAPSQAPPASQLGFDRGAEVKQPVVASRLAKAVSLLPNGSSKRMLVANLLAAVKDIEPAATYWRREFPNTPFPAELHEQTIGTVTARYTDPPAMRTQRRYAIGPGLFGLGRMARAAGRYNLACPVALCSPLRSPTAPSPLARTPPSPPSPHRHPDRVAHTGTHGLYIDGDIVASELYAMQYAAQLCGFDCPNLDDHLTGREAQLTQARAPKPRRPAAIVATTTCRAYAAPRLTCAAWLVPREPPHTVHLRRRSTRLCQISHLHVDARRR